MDGIDELDIVQQKTVLRNAMSDVVAQFCANKKAASLAAKHAADSLFESSLYIDARVICIFIASPEEIETRSIIEQALADGKCVAVPRVTNRDGSMELRCLDAEQPLGMQLEIGAFGLLEPNLSTVKINVDDFPSHALFLMPGLAFMCGGKRLGRGRGFYDRYIARIRETELAALCFSCQIIDSIPCVAHDVDMAYIVCDRGIISCDSFQYTGL